MTALAKKVFLGIIVLCVGLVAGASPARAQLGVAAGYGLDLLNQPQFSSSTQSTFESSGGFSVGLFYDFPISRHLTVRPGLFIRQSSYDWTLDEVEFSPLQPKIRTAEIPIDVRYRFPMKTIVPYVMAGPVVNFVHTDQPDLRQVLDSPKGTAWFMGITVGAGIEIPFSGLGLVLLPEIRYSHALSGFTAEEYIVRGVSFDPDGSQRMNHLTFRLGITFLSIR